MRKKAGLGQPPSASAPLSHTSTRLQLPGPRSPAQRVAARGSPILPGGGKRAEGSDPTSPAAPELPPPALPQQEEGSPLLHPRAGLKSTSRRGATRVQATPACPGALPSAAAHSCPPRQDRVPPAPRPTLGLPLILLLLQLKGGFGGG